jgi:penicillin amidase
MKSHRKWLVRIGVALLILMVVLTGATVWFVRRPWPKYDGTVTVPGLLASAEIVRDRWGVPHIYAENEHDLFFAQGYVHAQDRLFQMEVNRRLGSGTLSEIGGSSLIDIDKLVRTYGLRRVAEQSWPLLDQDTRDVLEAYAEGVNAYIDSHRNRLPVEFTILGVDPNPWTPIDTLTWSNVMAYRMGINHRLEIKRIWFSSEAGSTASDLLLPPPLEEDLPVIVPGETNDLNWAPGVYVEGLAAIEEWLGDPNQVWASNNLAIHGSRTESGMPILANDTHLGLQMPSVWYENGLHGGRFDSAGFTIPGIPLIVMGHNQRIAWGITNMDPDIQDLYIERVAMEENPVGGTYTFMGERHELEVVRETINVRGGEPEELDVLFTSHGPIVNDVFGLPPQAGMMALRWSLYDGGSFALQSIVSLNLATNWDEFRDALQYWDTLSQNFVYADVEGNIGYQATGKIPIRVPEHTGLVPVTGWTGEYEWQGFVPFEGLPSLFNPPSGFVATANNKVVPDDYPYTLSNDCFHPGYRAKRVNDLLAADDQFTIEDVYALQADTYSLPAEILRPYLLSVEPESDLQAKVLAEVEAWDLRYDVDSAGATAYEVWYRFLVRNTFGDELMRAKSGSDVLYSFEGDIARTAPLLIDLIPDADEKWFDDVTTLQVEVREDVISRSWTDAVGWLSERYGDDPEKWEWGDVHTIALADPILGQSGIAPLEALVNGPRIGVPGHYYAVNSITYITGDGSIDFDAGFGTTQRMVMDLSNWDNMSAVNSTGQSGHLFHPHREDQISLWQNLEYRPMPFTQDAVEAGAEATLVLTPQ